MVVRLIAILLVGWVGGAEALADNGASTPAYEPPDFMREAPPLPANIDASGVWRLDLSEALRLAVHQNLGIAIERHAVQIAGLGVRVAGGLFEPTLTAGFTHSKSRTPPLSAQQGAADRIFVDTGDDWRASLEQRIPTGMQLRLEFINSRSKSNSGVAVAPLNYRTLASLTATQPLFRGFSLDLVVPRIEVLRAEVASERERQQLLVIASDVVERTEAAYWDVVQALYGYDLEVRSRKRAEDQLDLSHRQIKAGLMPPSDVISAEATLAQRTLRVLQSEQNIAQATDRLRAVINLPRDQWSRPILPIDAPRFTAEARSAEDMLGVALKNRPEVAQLDLDLKVQQLSVRKADNDQLPQIDIGVSGNLVGQDSGAYGDALDQLTSGDARGYSVFVNLIWTPLNRANGAAADIERARERIAVLRRDQAVQDVWVAVREAVRTEQSAAQQVTAAARARELSTKSLEVEQRKFLNGTSSNFIVAQRQEELAGAQLAELTAVLSHKKATASVLRATGKLLGERQIELSVKQ